MEFNAEINKVFGQEMAKLFAATISQEELMAQAQKVWTELNKNKDNWSRRIDSELESYIKKEFLSELHDEVRKILAEPSNKEALQKRAREMVEEARRIGERAIIMAIAQNMVDTVLSEHNTRQGFVSDAMRELHVADSGEVRK